MPDTGPDAGEEADVVDSGVTDGDGGGGTPRSEASHGANAASEVDRGADAASESSHGADAASEVDRGADAASESSHGADAGATAATAPDPTAADALAFPPDEVLDLPDRTSFVRLLTLVVLVAFLVDLALVDVFAVVPGSPGVTAADSPFFASVVYLVAAIPLVRRVHGILAAVRSDVVELAGRETLVGGRIESDVTPEDIAREMADTLDRAFHPRVLLGGAAVAGAIGIGAVYYLNTAAMGESVTYAHWLTAFAYAAVHGLFAGPLLGGLVLVRRIANEYIVDVDVLAPDGIGGYRAIGDALVTLLTFAVVLVTFDLVVLSSALYAQSDASNWPVVAALYGTGLVAMVGLTTVSVVAIRNRLLAVRDRKIDDLREEFEAVETTYWEKYHRGEDNTFEATNIRTMRAMFAELNGMSLWPLNLYSVLKVVLSVVLSVGTSVLVYYVRGGLPF